MHQLTGGQFTREELVRKSTGEELRELLNADGARLSD